ncbi:hypothetical protein [Methanobrevibacter sp.]|uniref:hypothetical protein n=1 Tax=Methanobrevibacter sp. TaxID=66852 RepID=UPI00388D12DD
MKFKKLMIVSLLLLAILTIGAVSAADTADDLAVSDSDGDAVEASSDDVKLDDTYLDGEHYFIAINDDDIITEGGEDYNPENCIASIVLPANTTNGRFVAENDGEEIFSCGIDDAVLTDENKLLCNFLVKDLDLDKVNDGDTIRFTFYLDDVEQVQYAIIATVEISDDEDIIKFDTDHRPPMDVDYWREDWQGPIYTDSDGVIVAVDFREEFLDDFRGNNILVYVNGELIENTWQIDDSYHDWTLKDLEISDADDYRVTVVYLNEDSDELVLYDDTINVVDFGFDTFRLRFNYDVETVDLYCPENCEGTVVITTKRWYDEDDVVVKTVTYVLSEDDENEWKEWSIYQLGFACDGNYHEFEVTITNNNYELFSQVVGYSSDYDRRFWIPGEVNADDDSEIVLRAFTFPEDVDSEFYLILSDENDDVVCNMSFNKMEDKYWFDNEEDFNEHWYGPRTFILSLKDLMEKENIPMGQYNLALHFTKDYVHDETLDCNLGTIGIVPFVVNINDEEEVFTDILNYIFEIEVPEDADGFASVYVDGNVVFEDKPLSKIQYIDHNWRNGHFIRLNDLNITVDGEYEIQLNVTYNGNTRILTTTKRIEVGENEAILRSVDDSDDRYVEYYLGYPVSPDSILGLYLNGIEAASMSLYGPFDDGNAPLYSYELLFYFDNELTYPGGGLREGTYDGIVKLGDAIIGSDTFSIYDMWIYIYEDEFDMNDDVVIINFTVPAEFFNEHCTFYVFRWSYQDIVISFPVTEVTHEWRDDLNMYMCTFTPEELHLDDTDLFNDFDNLQFSFVYKEEPKYEGEIDDVDVGFELERQSFWKLYTSEDLAKFGYYDDESPLYIKPNAIVLDGDELYNESTWVARLYIEEYTASGNIVMTISGSDVELFNIDVDDADLGDTHDGIYGFNVCLNEVDFSAVQDKDVLELTFNDDNGDVYTKFIIAQRTDSFIKLYDIGDEGIEDYPPGFTAFYRNLTNGDYGAAMGWNGNGHFITVYTPTTLEDNDLNISITYDDGSFTKELSLSDLLCEFQYYVGDYLYSYAITDELRNMPDGNYTVVFYFKDQVITQKRCKEGDYVYKILTPDDFADQFDIDVKDKLYDANDVVLSILATDYTNRMAINFDLGIGYFSVYVNGTRLENLGRLMNCMEYEIDDYGEPTGNMIPSDVNATELELFYLCTDEVGCPELYLSLADLGITEAGTYNIRVTHFPSVKGGLDDHHENREYAAEFFYITETELINKDVVLTSHLAFIDIDAVDSDIVITLTDEEAQPIANATISYSINGIVQIGAITDENGKISVAAPEGDVIVTASYANAEESATLYFPVSTEMVVTNVGNAVIITLIDASGNKLAGEAITYIINKGEEQSATIGDNGQVIVGSFKGLTNVIGNYAGSALFKASTANATLDLPEITQNTTLSISEGNHSAIIVLVSGETPVAGANVTYTINSVAASGLTDQQGILTIGDLNGEIAIAASFAGDEIYNPSVASATFNFTEIDDGNSTPENTTVVPVDTILSATSPFTKTYTYNDVLVVVLKDVNGTPISGAKITIKIGKTTYNVYTNDKGKASCNVNVAPNKYTAAISYAGNATYAKSSATSAVTVYKAASAFKAKSKAFKAATKTKKYAVVLKANGKAVKNANVVLKIGSKKYKAITNTKGKAVFKITKLTKKGQFTSKIKFAGNSYFKGTSKAVKITIK